ncbi:hypothetical protein V5799_021383 [Amblyomma americanum]|uniref:Uncharacterized protein n=1 Tax=Amblyomma americanum TaxID=6943 RepID=A0AAQ4FQ97_AMBAM
MESIARLRHMDCRHRVARTQVSSIDSKLADGPHRALPRVPCAPATDLHNSGKQRPCAARCPSGASPSAGPLLCAR